MIAIINIKKRKEIMSDNQLKSELRIVIDNLGYPISSQLFCPLSKIVKMRYNNVSTDQSKTVISALLKL